MTSAHPKFIKSVGDPDFNIAVDEQYRRLTPGVVTKINALESTASNGFRAFYTDKINTLQTALTNAGTTATGLNAVVTAANALAGFLDPRTQQTVDTSILAESRFIKAPVYNLFATATGNGSIALLGQVAALSTSIANANFTTIANTVTAASYMTLHSTGEIRRAGDRIEQPELRGGTGGLRTGC